MTIAVWALCAGCSPSAVDVQVTVTSPVGAAESQIEVRAVNDTSRPAVILIRDEIGWPVEEQPVRVHHVDPSSAGCEGGGAEVFATNRRQMVRYWAWKLDPGAKIRANCDVTITDRNEPAIAFVGDDAFFGVRLADVLDTGAFWGAPLVCTEPGHDPCPIPSRHRVAHPLVLLAGSQREIRLTAPPGE